MYIDYNDKIRIIALYFCTCKVKVKVKKYIIIYILSKIIDYYNKEFICKRINNSNKITKYNYNCKQLEAIFSDEINNLVIAGPGSGKTTLIIGKINYLIEERKYLEKDILCLSFTNNACNHLKNKLKYKVDVMTFHMLAKTIVGKKYKINNNYLRYVIDEYFHTYVDNNIDIKIKVLYLIKKININKYQKYLELGYFDNIKSTIYKFINLFICSGYSYESFLKIKRNKILVRIIIDIYYLYKSELRAQQELDLNGLINEASIKFNHKLNYKYIIIDEFQDISNARYNLVNFLQQNTNSKILAVGDDFQAIYGFSGSNLESFFRILNDKDRTKIIKLNMNYRNSKELIRVATKFVMKNRKQEKKRIITTKSIERPIIIVREKDNSLERLITYIGDKQILILSRNNKDVKKYLTLEQEKRILSLKNVKYSTIHSAKGLEAEVVVIINLEDSIIGFPSKIKEHKLIEKTFFKEKIKYEEERRLFFVALTRSMTYVYLLEPKNPSSFLKEIKKDNKKYITFLDI